MTDRLRQVPQPATGASQMEPFTWAVARRTFGTSAAIGAFLSFVGAFGTSDVPFLPRTAFMVSLSLAGALLGMATFRGVERLALARRGLVIHTVLGALAMTPPMGVLVWGAAWAVKGGPAPYDQLPAYVAISLVMCLVMTSLAVFVSVSRRVAVVEAPASAPVKFLERLPLKLRGAEVWAVEAEDHYLRLHTSKGQDLILMRLADAVAELEGLEGTQVHRSWWVARDAVNDARRGDGRATLTLKSGAEVPVSRTYAKLIREAGWL